ncbi:biotin--[acetyl-CoA-carboxylase] ligase [Bacteroidia bacterium]|nr:biotin--[acetyl-CoA-carboxylase] ligase [Bacteroidia bacterium]
MKIIRIPSTDSTNRYLKELSSSNKSLPEGTVVVATEQTAGRGQAGNYWEAEAGKNLTFSLLLHPNFLSSTQHFLLSKAVALALTKALAEALSNTVIAGLTRNPLPSIQIKWPNDIYINNHKIAGILIENDWQATQITRSIIGIGLNVNQIDFKSNAPNPISIKQITGTDTNLDDLLSEILHHIYKVYEQLKSGKTETIATAYEQALYRKTGFHDYADKNGAFRAEIQSVSNEGLLHLRTDGGEQRSYAFKEVKNIL